MINIFGRRSQGSQGHARAPSQVTSRSESTAKLEAMQLDWEFWLDRDRPDAIWELGVAWDRLMEGRTTDVRRWMQDALEEHLRIYYDDKDASDWFQRNLNAAVQTGEIFEFPPPPRDYFEMAHERLRLRQHAEEPPIPGTAFLHRIEVRDGKDTALIARIDVLLARFADSNDGSAAAEALWRAIVARQRRRTEEDDKTAAIMQEVVRSLDGFTMALARPRRRPNSKSAGKGSGAGAHLGRAASPKCPPKGTGVKAAAGPGGAVGSPDSRRR